MTDHPEDKPLENKTPDTGGPASSGSHSGDVKGDHADFDRTIDLGAYVFPDPDSQSTDSTPQFDNMVEDAAEQPGGSDDNLNDENYALTTSVKKIELTEADYVEIDTASTDMPQAADGISDDMPEDINEPETAINSQVITAAANEAHALQDKPETTAEDKTPKTSPVEEPAVTPAPHPRTGLATALGLIGMTGALGALWMVFGLSGRMDQLESQLAAMQNNSTTLNQRNDIDSLSQRVDELSTQLTAHLKAVAQIKEASPVPDVKEPSAPAPVTTNPAVIAIKPAMDSMHGAWVVNLTSLSHAVAANNEVAHLKKLGIRAESIKIKTQGKIWYRIRVSGFISAEEADRQRKILGNRLGIHDAWIGKR